MTFLENFSENVMVSYPWSFYTLSIVTDDLAWGFKLSVFFLLTKEDLFMNIKKRFIAMCLTIVTVLSLLLPVSVKCAKFSAGEQSLLCDFYEEPVAKRC